MSDVNQNLMEDATLDQAERWDPLRLLGEEVGRMFERLGGASWRTARDAYQRCAARSQACTYRYRGRSACYAIQRDYWHCKTKYRSWQLGA